MSSPLQTNITNLQNLLEQVNALPEEITLPELTNPADASKALSGYEFINEDCEKVTGTIPTKTASDLTSSGATVTVPSGYYASQATKSVATATQATPSISVDSAGKITASATQTAGYVSAGTKTSTHQLAFQAAKTITPTTASQIAVSSGYYVGGDVAVAAIPSSYVKPSYTKGAATYTPTTTNQTIAAGTYLTGIQTIKGDSNLVAGNIKSGVSIFGVNGNYEGSGGGGDTSAEDGIITKTISSYTNDRVTSIGTYAFFRCTSLTSVSFPAATSIGAYAFNVCTSLTSVSFPVATSIGTYAFNSCPRLTSVSFPAAKSIGTYAFVSCTSLTSVSFPVATSIGDYAFSRCTSLTSVSFPAATSIGTYAFSGCNKLSIIHLGASSLCALKNSGAFSNTSIWSDKGSIFVPASLVKSYKAATNWTFFSNRIYSM